MRVTQRARYLSVYLSICTWRGGGGGGRKKKSSVVNDDDAIEMERRIVSRGGCWVTPMTNHAIGHLSTPATSLSLSLALPHFYALLSRLVEREERRERERSGGC